MGYTSVANREGAVEAARALAAGLRAAGSPASGSAELGELEDVIARSPLAIDQVSAESGIVERIVCARAYLQAEGDLARAVSLIRAWAANLPQLATMRTSPGEWRVTRRIAPAFVAPPGGQFLGASRDYEQRLLSFESAQSARGSARPARGGVQVPQTNGNAHAASAFGAVHSRNGSAVVKGAAAEAADDRGSAEALPQSLPPAADILDREGLLAPADPPAEAVDTTRSAASRLSRGGFLHLLSRAETGALTSMAYAAIRGHSQRQDPTLLELRCGEVPVVMHRPDGGSFVLGTFTATIAEIALYAMHESGEADDRFTLGIGATVGRIERRAIAAAMVDATTTRAGTETGVPRAPHDDREFLSIVCEGQESSGFVEHLKLPHYVTFAADLDRVRAARRTREGA
jgi:alpha-D-ribose 1-methylphosphonate 5-triphosphate synthase subunit PhnI